MKPRSPLEASVTRIREDFTDHRKFATEALSIRRKKGDFIPFEFAPGPRKLNEAIERQRRAGKPVRVIVLKARQVYISTAVAARFFHAIGFRSGQKAMVVSHETKSAQEIFRYYTDFHDTYEPFRGVVRGPEEKSRKGTRLSFTNGSYIDVQTANNLKGGRSFSLRFLHLSEFAFWRDAKSLMTGLMQAVPSDPDTAVIIESTANGVGGEFYNRVQEARDPSSGSEWEFVFIAWWEHPEYTIPPENPAAFQASLSDYERDEQRKYNLTLGQLNWRRWKIRNDCGGSVDVFKQEFPGCPEEAFLFSGRPRFSHLHLSKMPIISEPTSGEIEEFWNGPKRVLTFLPTESGALVLYRKPVQGKRYCCGVDLCQGLDVGDGSLGADDPDWSVAQILDADTGEQVAKVRARMQPSAFAEYMRRVLEWYNWAFVVPEINGPGISFIDALVREGYPPGLFYHRQPQPDEQFSSACSTEIDRIGWRTTQVTKVHLISILDQAIRELSIIIHDANTLQECRTFVILGDGKMGGQQGCHDDEVIALALGRVGQLHMPADARLSGVRAQQPPHVRNAQMQPGVQRYGARRSPTEQPRGHLFRP